MKPFTMPIIFWLMTIEDKKIREAYIKTCNDFDIVDDEVSIESMAILEFLVFKRFVNFKINP